MRPLTYAILKVRIKLSNLTNRRNGVNSHTWLFHIKITFKNLRQYTMIQSLIKVSWGQADLSSKFFRPSGPGPDISNTLPASKTSTLNTISSPSVVTFWPGAPSPPEYSYLPDVELAAGPLVPNFSLSETSFSRFRMLLHSILNGNDIVYTRIFWQRNLNLLALFRIKFRSIARTLA